MTTLYQPNGGAFRVTDHPIRFPSARDAIDAISAFEASTREDFEYEIRAVNGEGEYVAAANALIRINGKFVRGYLEANPTAFSVLGFRAIDADPAAVRPDFAAYSPTEETAAADCAHYRAARPDLKFWIIQDNATSTRA